MDWGGGEKAGPAAGVFKAEPERSGGPESSGARRRRREFSFYLLLLVAVAAGLGVPERSLTERPSTELAAAYRPDGGQRLSPEGVLPPNALTRLNSGQKIYLTTAPVRLLAVLPGLGPNSAAKARAAGCLPDRGRSRRSGLIEELCDRNNP